jgi:hypothetical protein
MKRSEMACVLFALVLCSSIPVEGQGESVLASRITQALKKKEPSWNPIVGVESGRIPLVPSEKRILVATWEGGQPGGIRESVLVRIYEVESPEQAIRWLGPARNKQLAAGWRTYSYRIGDEGYLAKYQTGKRFEIQFRRGTMVGNVAGNDLERVKQFANYVVAELSAN